MSHRLFIALRPPEPVRDALIDTMDGIENARWQGDDALHLTLRFIGEVERPQANDLAEALGRIDAPAFELAIGGVGAFERRREHRSRAHAVWAAVPATGGLELLRGKVERACEIAGLERETRKFVPHITLARLDGSSGSIGPWLARWSDLSLGPWEAREFVLYESHLGHGGAHYEAAATYPLR